MTVLKDKELKKFEADRDFSAELLASVEQMVAGNFAKKTIVEVPDIVEARQKTGLTQAGFAALLGVSKRTLQEWEQARSKPSGAAQSLIKIAIRHPEILRELQTT